jgi:hypothetical protein
MESKEGKRYFRRDTKYSNWIRRLSSFRELCLRMP